MGSYNLALLIGNLTRDPELRSTPQGKAVCEFTLAVNRPASPGGEKAVDFFPITVWEKAAEACAKHLKKGSLVHVEAHLRHERWEAEGGQKRSRMAIVANSVSFLGKKKESSEAAVPVAAGAAEEASEEKAADGGPDCPVLGRDWMDRRGDRRRRRAETQARLLGRSRRNGSRSPESVRRGPVTSASSRPNETRSQDLLPLILTDANPSKHY